MENIAFITYTNQKCADIWKPYFDSLDIFAKDVKSYVFNDLFSDKYLNHKFLIYEEDSNYCDQFCKLLEQVEEEYVIYMQEDFILYDYINKQKIQEFKQILSNSDLSFVRLIKCGVVTDIEYNTNLFYITKPNSFHMSINSFSMQPTLWKKQDLIKLYQNVKSHKFGECWAFIQNMNLLKINGLYCYFNEPKRGSNHHDSSVFPYIATAIVKGKWNYSEYTNEINDILDKYKIDKRKRGFV